MPKANPKCRNCAHLSAEEAMQRSCWKPGICPKRRYYYRSQGKPRGKDIQVEIAATPYVVLHIWQDNHHGRHAAMLELRQGEGQLAAISPVHLIGIHKRDVDAWIQEGLKVLSRVAVVDGVRQIAEHHPSSCPIETCPLRPPKL